MIREKNQQAPANKAAVNNALFTKENYRWMIAGAGVLLLGFVLMAGGKSDDPKVFNAAEVYSARRITIAPMLIIAGFILEIIGIMKKTGYEKGINK